MAYITGTVGYSVWAPWEWQAMRRHMHDTPSRAEADWEYGEVERQTRPADDAYETRFMQWHCELCGALEKYPFHFCRVGGFMGCRA